MTLDFMHLKNEEAKSSVTLPRRTNGGRNMAKSTFRITNIRKTEMQSAVKEEK